MRFKQVAKPGFEPTDDYYNDVFQKVRGITGERDALMQEGQITGLTYTMITVKNYCPELDETYRAASEKLSGH